MVLNDEKSKHGVRIEFRQLHYSILTNGENKDILKGVSGVCISGHLMAIMGRSGAGKTTLLDILAGHPCTGTLRGDITVDNKPCRCSYLKKISCYVMQKDVLLSSATVRESILTSALLRLPYCMPHRQKLDLVDGIIAELGLTQCQNTLIGDEVLGQKGVSGGEKRRVSMGQEMVTSPKVIFLDEPTSGLDSDTAVSIVEALVTLATNNRTVVMTVHQPSSDITEKFDDLMLMASGRVLYCGPFTESVQFVSDQGYACPRFKNPTDFYMSLVKNEKVATQLADAFSKLQDISAAEEGRNAIQCLEGRSCASSGTELSALVSQEPLRAVRGYATPLFYQTWLLWLRFARSWARNPLLFLSEFIQYIFFGVFLGLTYMGLSKEVVEGTYNRTAAAWYTLVCMSFTPAITAMTVWDHERAMLRREAARKSYRAASFFLAKTFTTFPVEVVFTCVFGTIVYFMIGFQRSFGKFLTYLITIIAFQLTSETMGTTAALVTPSSDYSNVVLAIILLFSLSFTGFLTMNIPPYFKWISKISYFNFAYNAILINEFRGLQFTNKHHYTIVPARLPRNVQEGYCGNSLCCNILACWGFLIGYRMLVYVLMLLALKIRFL